MAFSVVCVNFADADETRAGRRAEGQSRSCLKSVRNSAMMGKQKGRLSNKENVSPPDVEAVIRRHVSPIRPGRSRPRKMTVKHAVSFVYKVALIRPFE